MNKKQTFIGTKVVNATPMNRRDYNSYRNWKLPENEDGSDEGYLVEYMDGIRSNDTRHHGYISWSPKDVFEEAYVSVDKMSFGQAIEFMKLGKAVARSGWNGKGMFLYLVPANEYPAQTGVAKEYWGENSKVPYGAYIAMKTAQDNVVPWLASQTDVLAEDWMVL